MQLYWTKVLGCYARDGKVVMPFDSLAEALLKGTAHPDIYLRLGRAPKLGDQLLLGMSDLQVIVGPRGVAAGTLLHVYVGDVAVEIAYAPGSGWRSKRGVWHPRLGTSRFRIEDFSR